MPPKVKAVPKTAPVKPAFDSTRTHRQYKEYMKRWEQINICLDGEEAVKQKRETYLPYPVRLDDVDKTDDAFLLQYQLYLEGAHFVEYTAEAVEDLISSAFRRPLELEPELPKELEHLDVTDLSKELVGTVGAYGRAFAFVDYPTVDTQPSAADDDNNAAYLNIYEPLDVLDWTETKRSGKSELIRVVLREIDTVREAEEDIAEAIYMYRELLIKDGKFTMIVHRDDRESVTYIPKANGSHFTEIPGVFIGTTSNTVKVDKSPVMGISNSNLKHYQTWADLMHVQVYTGNPQLVLAGLAAGWNKQAERNKVTVKLDASQVLALEGDNSSASLLEIDTNSLVHFRTLEVLEQSMAEQGAKIKSISKKSGVESAEALKIRSSASMSKLAAIVANVEDALNKCIVWAGLYMGETVTTQVTINKEFFAPAPDGSLLSSISEAEAVGTAPRGTAITYLKQIELVSDDKSNEEYLADMELYQPQLTSDIKPDGTDVKGGKKPEKKKENPTEK